MFLQGGSRVLLMIAMALFLSYMIFFLATSRCTQGKRAVPCTSSGSGPTEVPWAVRSGNLTYLTEVPLDYIDSNDVYLIYSDLFYDLVGSDAPAVKQAAVRLEDVGPESDPKDLRRVADYLASENVPFQVAVIPIQIGQNKDGSDWYGLSLTDRPEVVDEWKDRLDAGRSVMEDAGLGEPTIFETPHYGGSVNSYVAMPQEYNGAANRATTTRASSRGNPPKPVSPTASSSRSR